MIKKSFKKIDTLAPKILTAQFLLYTNAVLWLGFGIYLFMDMYRANNSFPAIFLISFFLFLNVAVMIFCAITIGRRNAWAYYFSLFIVIVNTIFTRLGQFDVFDLLTFILDVIILVFFLAMGRAYLKAS